LVDYNDKHGRLPPAVVYGKDGKPLHSWRVLILPFIEEEELYRQFRLDEPWDSPHNRKLLSRMPPAYALPPGKASRCPAYHTVMHVFVGKGAAFEDHKALKIPDDFPDGTANTLLVVEAGEPVPWTKPQDLPYAPGRPLPDLRGPFPDGFRAALADGSKRFIGAEMSQATLRAAITRNGGDILGADWLD
jgi:hypothetical protein